MTFCWIHWLFPLFSLTHLLSEKQKGQTMKLTRVPSPLTSRTWIYLTWRLRERLDLHATFYCGSALNVCATFVPRTTWSEEFKCSGGGVSVWQQGLNCELWPLFLHFTHWCTRFQCRLVVEDVSWTCLKQIGIPRVTGRLTIVWLQLIYWGKFESVNTRFDSKALNFLFCCFCNAATFSLA